MADKDPSEYPEIPDPPQPREPRPDPYEESKLVKAYKDAINANARAEKWGRRSVLLENRINAALMACAEAMKYGKDIAPENIVHILNGSQDTEKKEPYGHSE